LKIVFSIKKQFLTREQAEVEFIVYFAVVGMGPPPPSTFITWTLKSLCLSHREKKDQDRGKGGMADAMGAGFSPTIAKDCTPIKIELLLMPSFSKSPIIV
jgi:hypothetical protein